MAGAEAICYPREAPGWARRFTIPLLVGLAAAGMLVWLYLGLVTWAQDFTHARELAWDDRYLLAAIAFGFGLQAALYTHLRLAIHGRLSRSSTATAVGGTGTSTVAMVACCAHHVAEALAIDVFEDQDDKILVPVKSQVLDDVRVLHLSQTGEEEGGVD